MLGEFKVSRCSRQCHVERRPLKEGEAFYSVVLASADGYERRDYSAAAWSGPPEGTVGHWKSRMPVSGEKKLVLAPREVLIDLLRQMESEPEQAKLRFLLALLLLRRRMVRLLATPPDDWLPPEPPASPHLAENPSGGDDSDRTDAAEYLHLEVVDDGTTVSVLQCRINRGEAETLSEALNDLLYCEAGDEVGNGLDANGGHG